MLSVNGLDHPKSSINSRRKVGGKNASCPHIAPIYYFENQSFQGPNDHRRSIIQFPNQHIDDVIPRIVRADVQRTGFRCLLAPRMILDRRTHQGNQMLDIRLNPRKFLILVTARQFFALYSSRKRVGNKIVGGSAARTYNWDAASSGFQYGHVKTFCAIWRNISIGSLI